MARPKKRNTQRRNLSSRVWRKWIIPVVVVLGVLALVVPTVLPGLIGTPAPASSSALPTEDMGESQQRQTLAVGSTPPGFSLQNIEGETISLESLEGKPVVVSFFAPWCPHCQDEAPRLNQIHAQYGDRVHIVSISATPFGKDYPAKSDKSPGTPHHHGRPQVVPRGVQRYLSAALRPQHSGRHCLSNSPRSRRHTCSIRSIV